MRGVVRSGPTFLAVFSSLNAGRFSVGAKIPCDISQFKCEAFFGLNQSVWRYFPLWARGVFRSEPEVLAICPSLNAGRLSARTKIPGKSYQFECEAFLGPTRNSWRFFPIWARGACRSEPKFLAAFPSFNARRFSVRTKGSGDPEKFLAGAKVPGGIYQFECEARFGRDQNPWQYSLMRLRGFFQTAPKFLAVFSSLNARRFLVRTEIPVDTYQSKCGVSVCRNQISQQYVSV